MSDSERQAVVLVVDDEEDVRDLLQDWPPEEVLALQANVYAMEFSNEIALTGELSEIGLPLRRNVDDSYRRGVELVVVGFRRRRLSRRGHRDGEQKCENEGEYGEVRHGGGPIRIN